MKAIAGNCDICGAAHDAAPDTTPNGWTLFYKYEGRYEPTKEWVVCSPCAEKIDEAIEALRK